MKPWIYPSFQAAGPLRLLAGLCLLLACSVAGAQLSEVSPGDMPRLGEDEGLLLVAVDSPHPLYGVRLARDGRMLGSELLGRLPKGRSHRLFRARAGEYQWIELQRILDWRVRLRDDPEFRFSVQPGRINYPGDLLFEGDGVWRARLLVSNRGLAALDWLQEQHPALASGYGFEYVGHYPDPFPAFYREQLREPERASRLEAARKATPAPPPEPGVLRLPPERLWRSNPLQEFAFSPDGRFLALHVKTGKDVWVVDMIDLVSGLRHRLARSALAYKTVSWSGVNRLLLEVGPYGDRIIDLVRIDTGDPEQLRFESVRLPRRGLLIDALPAQPDHILLGSYTRRGELMVHRVDMGSQAKADAFRSVFRERLNAGVANDITWLADGQGRLRLALVVKDGKRVLLHGADGHFEPLTELEDEVDFEPYSLSYDGSLIYGTTDHERSQRDLVAYDVGARKMGDTLFSSTGVDVHRPILDHRGEPIGVSFYRGGQRYSEFFGAEDRRQELALRTAFAGRHVATAARSVDGSQRLLWIDAVDQPPQLFHFDARERRASPVLQAMPWLEGLEFAPSQVIAVKATDGTALDAFLTLPEGDGPRPLVVFPHGGPIGVADTLHFDREVQFLAALGYAVLQVNFRGSDGYGRAFREAGQGNFGRLIEDDIDAALQQVLATQPIDRERLCIVGASYGGYSALVSAVRWPGRFRCAVSINGVSDLPLHLSASESAASPKLRARLEQIIGDPRSELDAMQAASPVYQHARLQTPLLLVHALRDRRVDPEQSQRMLRMLQLNGQRPSVLWFEKQGHALAGIKAQRTLWRSVAGFLGQHLDGPAAKDTAAGGTPNGG